MNLSNVRRLVSAGAAPPNAGAQLLGAPAGRWSPLPLPEYISVFSSGAAHHLHTKITRWQVPGADRPAFLHVNQVQCMLHVTVSKPCYCVALHGMHLHELDNNAHRPERRLWQAQHWHMHSSQTEVCALSRPVDAQSLATARGAGAYARGPTESGCGCMRSLAARVMSIRCLGRPRASSTFQAEILQKVAGPVKEFQYALTPANRFQFRSS